MQVVRHETGSRQLRVRCGVKEGFALIGERTTTQARMTA